MKKVIIYLFLLFFSNNSLAVESVFDSHTNTLDTFKNLSEQDIKDCIENLEKCKIDKRLSSQDETNQLLKELKLKLPSNYNSKKNDAFDFSELLKKSRPFWIIGIILLFIIFRSAEEEKPKTKTRNKNESADRWVEEKNKKDSTRKADRDREDEWDYDEEIDDLNDDLGELKIKTEIKDIGNIYSYAIKGKGTIDIFSKLVDQDNEKAKFSISIFDVTEPNKRTEIPCGDENYAQDGHLFLSREMTIEPRSAYLEWSDMFFFPKVLLVPAYRGKRKIEFVLNVTSIDTKFLKGEIKTKKKENLYFQTKVEIEINYEEPGYSEITEFEEDVTKNIIQLGMALAYSENKMEQRSLDVIKNWINNEIMWKNIILDEEQAKENKMKYSFLLNNTYQLLKDKRLSMSNIIKELNNKTNLTKKYETINLLLNIAGADDKLSLAEDKLLNITAAALELDLERFQQMKTSTIANIETVEGDDENEDTIFNFTPGMTDEDKCKKLRIEYTRWNRQTNNSNEKIRLQAKKMTELAANLRKKYNC